MFRNLNLNSDYLTRLFKKYLSLTTLQYLNHLKIQTAILLLTRTKNSVQNTAYDAYFKNPKVFMRRFKLETGLTPTKYRKNYKPIHLNNPHIDPQIPLPKRVSDFLDSIPENGNLVKNKPN